MSIEAEQAVLGGLMLSNVAWSLVSDSLTDADFSHDAHRAIYRAMRALSEKQRPLDAVTVAEWMDANGCLELVSGGAYLIELASTTPSAANIEAYAGIVADHAKMRRLAEAGTAIAHSAINPNGADADTLLAEAQERLAQVSPREHQQVKTATDGLTEMVNTLQIRFESGGRVTGVPTGIEGLDEHTSGFQPGNLIVLVGETSMGKSTEALVHSVAAAKYARERDEAVAIFSLEMTAGEWTERGVAHLADMPLSWITQPAAAPDYAMDRMQVGCREFKQLPLLIDDRGGLTLEQITSRAIQLNTRRKLSLVVVDYMHIMGRPRRNDVAELGGIAAGLKNLSKRISAPVLALHQLNRSNSGQRPTLGDIRASGEIAEAANLVLAIYRSEIARPDYAPLHGYAETLVLKNRQGRRDVRAWMKSRIGNMRLDSCEAPEGYDETIKPDLDRRSSGNVVGIGASGGIASRSRTSSQSRAVSGFRGGD